MQLTAGQDDDFDAWSSAWILYTTIDLQSQPTEQIRVNGPLLQPSPRTSDGSLVRLRSIPLLRLEYQVSRAVLLRCVGQYDGLAVDEPRDESRSGDHILIRTATGFRRTTATERGGLRADWLFSYQPSPGTVLFAGYGANVGSDEFSQTNLPHASGGFFVKSSYLFQTR